MALHSKLPFAEQGDEVTVLYRKIELTLPNKARENRQISGCRPGKCHYPCIVPHNLELHQN
jgi:hypothetical protein